MQTNYPFTAIVGQDGLKDALLWLAVDPKIGGVLISGTRGTAKSTAARALADLLPFGTPFVDLPVGSTEDRVIGSIDVSALLSGGERRFEPGLLARANDGVLYVDEVNLLPDHIVDVLLDAVAMGKNIVERDGASFVHDARIALVGSMNPEEGELRPQLLDRFGLCVAVANDDDLERRTEIAARRMAFELDATAFCSEYMATSRELGERIATARAMLARVQIDRSSLQYAAKLAIAARVEGMRADLTIVRTARAIAALDARMTVTLADIDRASEPALAHRRREGAPDPPSDPRKRPEPSGSSAPSSSPAGKPSSEQQAVVFDVGALLDVKRDATAILLKKGPLRENGQASRGRSDANVARGHARHSLQSVGPIAPIATIRAAVLERIAHVGSLQVQERHLRFVQRRGRQRQLIIFVVDASGSMAAAARMRAAKGVVCGLLEDAYHRRDSVALIVFRNDQAQMAVPPTRSALLAYRRLRTMATGGRTPLGEALRMTTRLVQTSTRRDATVRMHVVLVTDARANVPTIGAFEAAVAQANALRALGVRALCIDTESGRIRLGNASRIASALGASYQRISECTQRSLGAAVREWMAVA